MEDDVKKPVVEAEDPVNIAAQLRVERLHYQRELRGLGKLLKNNLAMAHTTV